MAAGLLPAVRFAMPPYSRGRKAGCVGYRKGRSCRGNDVSRASFSVSWYVQSMRRGMLFVATRAATAAVNGFGKGEGMKVEGAN